LVTGVELRDGPMEFPWTSTFYLRWWHHALNAL